MVWDGDASHARGRIGAAYWARRGTFCDRQGRDAVRGREGSLAGRGPEGRVRADGQAAGDSVHRPGRSPADREDGPVSA